MREVWAQEQLRVYVQHEARQHRMAQTQYMDVVLCCFLSHGSIQNGYPGRAVITNLVSMRSVCAMSRSVIRCVIRVLLSPEHTITTNALYVSDSAGNVLSTNPKEKLGLEQRSGATDFRSKGYRVSTCGFPTHIRFRS